MASATTNRPVGAMTSAVSLRIPSTQYFILMTLRRLGQRDSGTSTQHQADITMRMRDLPRSLLSVRHLGMEAHGNPRVASGAIILLAVGSVTQRGMLHVLVVSLHNESGFMPLLITDLQRMMIASSKDPAGQVPWLHHPKLIHGVPVPIHLGIPQIPRPLPSSPPIVEVHPHLEFELPPLRPLPKRS